MPNRPNCSPAMVKAHLLFSLRTPTLSFLPTLQLYLCCSCCTPAGGARWRCQYARRSCSLWWWPAETWAGRRSSACWRGPLGSRASTPWWAGLCRWRCSPCSGAKKGRETENTLSVTAAVKKSGVKEKQAELRPAAHVETPLLDSITHTWLFTDP